MIDVPIGFLILIPLFLMQSYVIGYSRGYEKCIKDREEIRCKL